MAVIGAGRVGTALAVLLERAGHRIVAASGGKASAERVHRYLPGTLFLPASEAAREARVALIGVPDDAIATVCNELVGARALSAAQTVIHLSGSVGLGPLVAAEEAGAQVLSFHPLQSFPDVDTGIARMPGSGVALTAKIEGAFDVGERLARDVGGVPFHLAEEVKTLYHSAAVFASNYLVVVEGMAERIMKDAGIGQPLPLLEALARTAFDRAFSMGPGAALTGPVVRADTGTIRRNLQALEERAPDLVPVYVELARAALRMAVEAGRVFAPAADRVTEELARWR